MQSLFDPAVFEDLKRRLESIQPTAPRQWGKMSVSQMLEHVARALEMASGQRPSKQMLLGRLIGWTVRKKFVGEEPFGKNSPTGPAFVVKDEPDFAATKTRVKALLDEFYRVGERGCEGNVHGFFGRMTGAEWGVTQYKHLDHHFRQFGV